MGMAAFDGSIILRASVDDSGLRVVGADERHRDAGIYAAGGSVVHVPGAIVEGSAGPGFVAERHGYIYAANALSQLNGGAGLSAHEMSLIHTPRSDLVDNGAEPVADATSLIVQAQ